MKKYLFHAVVLPFLILLTQLLSQSVAHGAPGDFLFQWGAQQHLSDASGVTLDESGNVYVTDTSSVQVFNSAGTRIRKWGSYGSGDGQFKYPNGIEVDTNGNVYVVDTENQRVQVFDNAGNFLGKWGSAGTGNGQFIIPRDIAIDESGNVYITETGSYELNYSDSSVQVFDRDGNYLRRLGSVGTGAGQFRGPTGITVDSNGDVYVADAGNSQVQVFSSAGNFIRTAILNSTGGYYTDIAVDSVGNIYLPAHYGDYDHWIEVYDSSGIKIKEFKYYDNVEREHFWIPIAIAVDQVGNAYTLDQDNDGLRVFTSAGSLLSQWWTYGTGDGQLSRPSGIAVDKNGNVYETDGHDIYANVQHNRVQVFDREGKFQKWVGHEINGTSFGLRVDDGGNVYVIDVEGVQGDDYPYNSVHIFDSQGTFLRKWGEYGSQVGQFIDPGGIAVNAGGDVYVVDSGNSRVQVFGNAGNFLRQFGSPGTGNGQFNSPQGIAIDANGNIFVTDSGNSRVQVFNSAGAFLRKWGSSGFTNGRFSSPSGIAVDGNGNVFVADTGNNRIQVFNSFGTFLLKIGSKGDDNAFFNEPRGVALDSSGTRLYVADTGNNRIQVFAGYGNQSLPTPWVSNDIGAVGLAGSASSQSGTFTLRGSGSDIWGTADGFRYVYQPLTGDGQITARVVTLQSANSWAKAGVMIRETLAANSRNAIMALTPGNGANFQRRLTSGGSTVNTAGPRVTVPYWARLVRSGNTISGYVSTNGITWTLVGSDTISMAGTVYIGLALTNHGNTVLSTATLDGVSVTTGGPVTPPTVNITAPANGATFAAPASIAITATATAGTGATVSRVDFYAGTTLIGSDTTTPYSFTWSNVAAGSYSLTARVTDSLSRTATSTPVGITVTTNGLPTPWVTGDIGTVGLAGSASYQNNMFSLRGSGSDIWGTVDGFRYVYHTLTGDGQITARVATVQNTNTWAKAGVMIRENLTANSRNALMAVTPGNGTAFQRRLTSGGTTVTTAGPRVAAPYWVRLVRSGNTFSGYVSSNGVNWTLVGSSTITMTSSVYVGLAVTSHTNAALCTTTMDSVQ